MVDQDQQYLSREESFHITGLRLEGYSLVVPLDYENPKGKKIKLYFRIAEASSSSSSSNFPYLLYLQGGPGMEAPRPTNCHGWIGKAVQYFRVVLLDQRGTGKSSPINTASLKKLGSSQEQAEYLQHFRADNIVKDAEAIRVQLVGEEGRWSILGQSFGGFCCLTYLSFHPQGLAEVLLTGGIPPGIEEPCSADLAYKNTFKRVMKQNWKYYKRFPDDTKEIQKIVKHLQNSPGGGVNLPDGSLLTPRGFQTLGLSLLGFAEGFERLHYLLESAFESEEEEGGETLSPTFLMKVFSNFAWDTNPLYAVLHESIYCQGAASNWAAERIRKENYDSEFDAIKSVEIGREVFLTGEMVFPFMFEEFKSLQPFREAAQILAEKKDWPKLYDIEQLKSNRVPVAAMCYYEDMYVDFNLAEDTAQSVGNLRTIVTNEHMHSGIRENGEIILEKLLSLTRNSKALF